MGGRRFLGWGKNMEWDWLYLSLLAKNPQSGQGWCRNFSKFSGKQTHKWRWSCLSRRTNLLGSASSEGEEFLDVVYQTRALHLECPWTNSAVSLPRLLPALRALQSLENSCQARKTEIPFGSGDSPTALGVWLPQPSEPPELSSAVIHRSLGKKSKFPWISSTQSQDPGDVDGGIPVPEGISHCMWHLGTVVASVVLGNAWTRRSLRAFPTKIISLFWSLLHPLCDHVDFWGFGLLGSRILPKFCSCLSPKWCEQHLLTTKSVLKAIH